MFRVYRIVRNRLSSAYQKKSLVEILITASADLPLPERVIWLQRLIEWLGTPISSDENTIGLQPQNIRLKLFIRTLNENPLFKTNVVRILEATLPEIDPLDFFCDAGMVSSQGFVKELLERILLRYLPAHRDYRSLSSLANQIFDGSEDADWIEKIDHTLLLELWKALEISPEIVTFTKVNFATACQQARRILAARLASLSSTPEFRVRVAPADRFLLIDLTEHNSKAVLSRCSRIMEEVYQSLEGTGVSVELVFLLERMKGLMARLTRLNQLTEESADLKSGVDTLCAILRDQEEKNSVLGFLNSNLNLISKKIVERAGITGENYIARTASEFKELFWSAGGGGVLTVATTLLKSGTTKLGLPLFVEGLFNWINYSLSFMAIQFAHLTLATKTPAMTAPVLAEKLKSVRSTEAQQSFMLEVRHIVRSGFMAVLGNVTFVLIGAVVTDLLYFSVTGSHILANKTGITYLQNHHLFTSLTLWYAAFTGCVLWFASALGGWFENWFAYRGIKQAIDQSYFLKVIMGFKMRRRVSDWVSRNVMGIATNIALGFLLAFSAIFGKFFGIPLDVRHVTLSSGTIGFSLMSLDNHAANTSLIGFAVASIAFIGLLNFSVSFVISLFIAAKARDVRLNQLPKLFRHWRRG